jgi:hypothetical protein
VSRLIREGDDEYIVYNDEERRLAMDIALIAVWLFVVWLPLRMFIFDFLLMDAIGIVLGIAVVNGFFLAVEGRSSLGDGD